MWKAVPIALLLAFAGCQKSAVSREDELLDEVMRDPSIVDRVIAGQIAEAFAKTSDAELAQSFAIVRGFSNDADASVLKLAMQARGSDDVDLVRALQDQLARYPAPAASNAHLQRARPFLLSKLLGGRAIRAYVAAYRGTDDLAARDGLLYDLEHAASLQQADYPTTDAFLSACIELAQDMPDKQPAPPTRQPTSRPIEP